MTTIIPGEIHYYTINYSPIEFIDDMPAAYFLLKLRENGEHHFNNFNTADAELRVEGLSTQFWVHKDYLILQSPFFREIFKNATENALIIINVPSPENFAPLLEFLYTGDSEKWYDTINEDNYYDVWLNLEFLGLGTEVKAIFNAYYQNEVLEMEEENWN
ncbi:hypothetical protein C1645_882492 [Glomus cerebriforme]|uniref:BTB domain-containing protein n=1 Tax=Glomus cerebriforme TaxID=658196 RepID=A0A397S651_9GLOM|nr:hypothetical protein C1645_882492 [Glomus cerebriforme]